MVLYDNLGHKLWAKNIDVLAGDNFISAEFFTGLTKGAYNLRIENELGLYTIVRAIL